MNKRQKTDRQIQIIATIVGTGFKIYENYQKQKAIQTENPSYQYNLKEILKEGLIGGAIGFGSAYIFCGIKNHFLFDYDDVSSINENEYLKEVVESYEVDESIDAVLKAEELMDILDDEFYNELDEKTTFQGSLSKETFVEGMSDVDVAVRFTNESFYLSETRDVLYYFFKNLDDCEIINVRKQPSSIGIFCKVDDHKFKIDFVPQRLQSNGVDYSIYRNSRNRNEKPTYKKTNPKIYEEVGRYKKSKLEMVKLFKVFKTISKLPISGFITERFVFEIMNNNIHQLASFNRFQRVKLIADEITNQIHDIELFDPANSNNMLTENLTKEDRNKVYDHFDKLSNDLENDSRILRKYFPKYQSLI